MSRLKCYEILIDEKDIEKVSSLNLRNKIREFLEV